MKCDELKIWVVSFAMAVSVAAGCTDTHPTPGDKNTNWLAPCKAGSECGGGLDCIANVCTRACDAVEDCKVPELALRCAAGVCAASTTMPMAGSSAPAPDASMPAPDASMPAPDASMPAPDGGKPMPMACGEEGSTRKPGPNRYDTTMPGPGACSGTTLAGVIAAIHAAYPDLADISYVFNPDSPPPPIALPNSVTAFELQDGFAIAMRRGRGDCESGCIENEYWYFRTDASCAPQQIAHYRPQFYEPSCMLEGYPMWDEPVPPAELHPTCGTTDQTRPLKGAQTRRGCGKNMACAGPGSGKEAEDIIVDLEVQYDRNEADPTMGFVTLQGTGFELLDGRLLPATFDGGIVRASAGGSLPSTCLAQFTLELLLDFDDNLAGYLRYEEARTPNCLSGGELCKGSLQLDFARDSGECVYLQQDIITAIDWARVRMLDCETDDDCAAVYVGAECMQYCEAAVRADKVAELQQIMVQVGNAFCADTTCRSAPGCVQQRGVCLEGRCATVPAAP